MKIACDPDQADLRESHILVTGGTGTLGHALVPELLSLGAAVTVFSRDEKKQQEMRQKFDDIGDLQFIVGDVRDWSSIYQCQVLCDNIDVVIHAAAMKQVRTCEKFPMEAMKTNVGGTDNVINLARLYDSKVIFISSDKAVNPINTYGLTKALAEKIVLNANGIVLRYGNILNSRGSVIENWFDSYLAGKTTFNITNHQRYFFQASEAVACIIELIRTGNPYHIYVPHMKSTSITELGICFRSVIEQMEADGKLGQKNPISFIRNSGGIEEKDNERIVTDQEYLRLGRFSETMNVICPIPASMPRNLLHDYSVDCISAPKWELTNLTKVIRGILDHKLLA